MDVNEKRLKDRGDKLVEIDMPRNFIDDNMKTDVVNVTVKTYPDFGYLFTESELLEMASQSLARVWRNMIKGIKTHNLWSKRLSGYYKRYPGKNARKLRVVRKLLNT